MCSGGLLYFHCGLFVYLFSPGKAFFIMLAVWGVVMEIGPDICCCDGLGYILAANSTHGMLQVFHWSARNEPTGEEHCTKALQQGSSKPSVWSQPFLFRTGATVVTVIFCCGETSLSWSQSAKMQSNFYYAHNWPV